MATHTKHSERVPARAAATASSTYLAEIVDIPKPKSRIEEVELTDDGRYCLITLSCEAPVETAPFMGTTVSTGGDRQYKVFRVDAKTGEVLSMKMREIG
jgi:hypothetical protein